MMEFVNGFRMTSLQYEMENNPVMFETTNQLYIYIIIYMVWKFDMFPIYELEKYISWNIWNHRSMIYIYISMIYNFHNIPSIYTHIYQLWIFSKNNRFPRQISWWMMQTRVQFCKTSQVIEIVKWRVKIGD